MFQNCILLDAYHNELGVLGKEHKVMEHIQKEVSRREMKELSSKSQLSLVLRYNYLVLQEQVNMMVLLLKIHMKEVQGKEHNNEELVLNIVEQGKELDSVELDNGEMELNNEIKELDKLVMRPHSLAILLGILRYG
jgi:hypothetical protein